MFSLGLGGGKALTLDYRIGQGAAWVIIAVHRTIGLHNPSYHDNVSA